MWTIIILAAAFLVGMRAIPVSTPQTYTPPPPVSGDVLEGKVNAWRVSQGLTSLPEEESLCKYAEIRATQAKTTWNHNQFHTDQCLKTSYGQCGENLAKDFQTEKETLQAWINSPTHYENLKSNWSAMCIKCETGTCAQEFGI